MQAVDSAAIAATSFATHRGDGIAFQRLIQGREGAPDNFELSLVHMEPGYSTPRHHHNFDQIHLVLEGRHQYAPDRYMPAGTVTYFPEGAFYGPQTGEGSVMLGLQLAGASGNGFMSYDQLAAGNRALAERGTFERGTYQYIDAGGKRRNKDGYEAIWEEVNGRPVVYPEPRFEQPIVMWPEVFAWLSSADEPGIAHRHLASFTERRTTVGFTRYDSGSSHRVATDQANELHFVLRGTLRCRDVVYGTRTALRFEAGEREVLEALEATETYVVGLPWFAAS